MAFLDHIPLNSLSIGETGIVQSSFPPAPSAAVCWTWDWSAARAGGGPAKKPLRRSTAYFIRGAVSALRSEDAGKILVER